MNKHKGFTLIEVLVALIIVAIGVLGHAKMQMTSMQTAQRASFSQTANTALLDLAQRMRSNSVVASHFVASNLNTGDAVVADTNCSEDDCTNNQFATAELAEWFNHLQNTLPSPRFSVERAGSLYTLTLIWDAAKKGAGSAVCDNSKINSYQCGSMNIWIP
ncbi:type IV pilus modification protein PilV [Psychromonas sp. RZ22]|uniref:type IV pilus modification protein PilV n=1 Tax=Psychromonas algarum TaxID=2555643 RepID=UPI001068C1AA|nr:type IV pilus modification protein PilV [Psychromonas sp. RZ22]TEW56785.1 type IV pilus modification protein PilV [Psychromonas sp. RZ22]